MSNTQFDIIIVGGGIVGLSLAALLAPHSFKIAVLEAQAINNDKRLNDSYDVRVSAITRASENILRHAQVWNKLESQRLSPYRFMRVWDEVGFGAISFDSANIGEPNLGHIIENRLIQHALWQRLQRANNVTLLCPELGRELQLSDPHITLQTQSHKKITAKLCVGADGANSWVRQQAGFPLRQSAYHQRAIVANVTTAIPHQQTAYQCFLRHGVLAFLPFAVANACSIVWSTDPARANYYCGTKDTEFANALTQAFEARLGEVKILNGPLSFPLRKSHALAYVGHRIALIGDAAHTIHPLAGQGLNLGLLDAACLADVVCIQAQKKRDIGEQHHLKRYQRWRKGENLVMQKAMDGFKQLFASQHPPLILARSLGLNLTQRIAPLKNFFIKRALGLSGDLPPLAKRCAQLNADEK